MSTVNRQGMQNRAKFADLIYSTKRFTKEQIVEKFRRQQKGDVTMDGGETLFQYLESLREHGILRCKNWVYFHPKRF
jgi:hypothetical protein